MLVETWNSPEEASQMLYIREEMTFDFVKKSIGAGH
jgi:hypothetical protein